MQKVFSKIVPVAIVVGMAMVSVWPWIKDLRQVAKIGSDGWFITWAINTQAQFYSDLLRTGGGNYQQLFQGGIFYPKTNVLAYSDMFFVSGLWADVSRIWGSEIADVTGVVLVMGQVGTAVASYWWWRKLGAKKITTMVMVGIWITSAVHLHYIVHLHTWNMTWWLIGSGLAVDGYTKNKQIRLLLGAIVVGLQFWEAPMGMYFGLVLMAVGFWLAKKKKWKKILVTWVIVGLVSGPAAMVYGKVARERGGGRTIREAAHGGMSIEETITKFGSWGLGGVMVAAGWITWRQKQPERKSERYMLMVAVIGLALALGPVLKWKGQTVKVGNMPIPLPYTLAYYLVPGMQAFREPSRWITVAGWGVAGWAALKLSKADRRWVVGGVALVAIQMGQMGQIPREPVWQPGELPEVDKWLASQPGQVVWEVPMGDDRQESMRIYSSLYTKKKLINGFSGFIPKEVQELEKRTQKEISEEEWRRSPADYLVVHQSYPGYEEMGERFKNWIQYKDETSFVVGRGDN